MRILVVDDNTDSADSMGDLLRHFAHEVTVSYGPLDALDQATTFNPELTLVDITMPDMDGLELADALQRRSESPGAFVAMTGMNRPGDRERAAQLGVLAFFVKPVRITELLEVIATLEQGRVISAAG